MKDTKKIEDDEIKSVTGGNELTQAPELPVNDLPENIYNQMFDETNK